MSSYQQILSECSWYIQNDDHFFKRRNYWEYTSQYYTSQCNVLGIQKVNVKRWFQDNKLNEYCFSRSFKNSTFKSDIIEQKNYSVLYLPFEKVSFRVGVLLYSITVVLYSENLFSFKSLLYSSVPHSSEQGEINKRKDAKRLYIKVAWPSRSSDSWKNRMGTPDAMGWRNFRSGGFIW